MQVEIDGSRCTLCGDCEQVCPQVFELGTYQAEIQRQPDAPDAAKACRLAAASCPKGVILIAEDEAADIYMGGMLHVSERSQNEN